MDALDIMANIEHVHPYFQAIFSAEDQVVIGYEILGRIYLQNQVESLGAFFWDESIPNEYKLEVESFILHQALDRVLKQGEEVVLFINQNPNILVWDEEETILTLLLEYEKQGLKLNQIVLEITIHHYEGNIDFLKNLIAYYRTYGIQIAFDQVGKESSNLNQIRLLQPDILKIDLHDLKVSSEAQSNYQDVLTSLSTLARRIGATLLFEEIEDEHHLRYAFIHGGRYYQGYYLHRPSNEFIQKEKLKPWLNEQFQRFTRQMKQKLFSIYQFSEELNAHVSDMISKGIEQPLEEQLYYYSQSMDGYIFRLYICDEAGVQLSPNRVKKGSEWIMEEEYIGKNWSWRPYFLDNIIQMKEGKKGRLSDVYIDIETGKSIRTFSYPINIGMYLFIDISFEYLYKNHILL